MASDQAVTTAGPVGEVAPQRWWMFANSDFAKLWAGETISQLGSQITLFALPLVAILTLHATVFEVGLLNGMRYLPVIAIALPVGVWFDRRRRRPVLIACACSSAVVIGLVPLASAIGVLSIGLLCVVAVAAGALGMAFDIGSFSYVPSLVEQKDLAKSNARLQASIAVAGIAGPSLAGFLVGLITAPITLSVDAVSFLFSAAGLVSISRREPPVQAPSERSSIRRFIAEGLQAVYGSRLLRTLLSQMAMVNLASGATYTLFVVYAVRQLGISPFKLGLVIAGMAAGSLVGAVTGGRVRKALGLGRSMALNTAGASLPLFAILIPHGAGVVTVVILALAHFIYGINITMLNVSVITLRQVITRPEVLGRMNASYRMIIMGTMPLGSMAGGLLGTALGLRPALVIALIALATPVAWVFFAPAFRLTEMPSGPEAVA